MDYQLHETTITCSFLELPVIVTIAVRGDYATTIDFSITGEPFTFCVTTWSSNGMGRFLRLFHTVSREPDKYGQMESTDDGQHIVRAVPLQKCNSVVQASKDIMKCLYNISNKYRKSVLEYAIWYCEHHREQNTYSQYITWITCHCIVHHELMIPKLKWELVTLDGVEVSG